MQVDSEARGLGRVVRRFVAQNADERRTALSAEFLRANLRNEVARARLIRRVNQRHQSAFEVVDRSCGGSICIDLAWLDVSDEPARLAICTRRLHGPKRGTQRESQGIGLVFTQHAQERAVQRLGARSGEQQVGVLASAWRSFNAAAEETAKQHGYDYEAAAGYHGHGRTYLVTCTCPQGYDGLAVIIWQDFGSPACVTILDSQNLGAREAAIEGRWIAAQSTGKQPSLSDVELLDYVA